MKEPQYVAQTLRWCNARREEQGKAPLKRLPKGLRSDAMSCPCGVATGMWVFVEYYHALAEPDIPTPKYVAQFVQDFDAGLLPQYETKASLSLKVVL